MVNKELKGDSQEQTKEEKKDPLSAGQAALEISNEPSVDPIVPVGKKNDGPANPKQEHAYCQSDGSVHPLNKFEKRTILFGWLGLGIGFFSLLIACIAGFLIYHQWWEMNSQTDYMNRAAIQARRDSAASSEAITKQLAALQDQITAAQNGTKALQGQMTEARRSRELTESQWEAQQRPWVGLSGNVEMPKPPIFITFADTPPRKPKSNSLYLLWLRTSESLRLSKLVLPR
jgi:hypothetical protein